MTDEARVPVYFGMPRRRSGAILSLNAPRNPKTSQSRLSNKLYSYIIRSTIHAVDPSIREPAMAVKCDTFLSHGRVTPSRNG